MRPGEAGALELVRHGRIEVQGRLVDASNATLFGSISHEGVRAEAVYKPIRGERPLWDFPDGTLAGREVASYLLSEAAGWGLVPPTVLRDGPFGPGMVQLWVDVEPEADLVDVIAPDAVQPGWRTVLEAHDRFGDPAVLAHADHPSMRLLAVLDVVLNNADRKGGHVLHAKDGAVYGVDHGICLHHEDKLRTVLWGWIGEQLPEQVAEVLTVLRERLAGDLGEALAEHLTRKEIRATEDRISRLLETAVFPEPSGEWPAIPWPAF
ncbi:SCO1664 family protein [Allokutzneria sp. A3M-2-11 16]|uniref:SCO1664 family protein n=1 Tax=Allokutzneria sp. A3M-2-11 16 TaxID=2962043 RepID=UPI0020B765D9|nr:SCO1664 family protein [Allokutzneria sp. A3M-2-11 16]MCP3804455.1 SCO1664 family protein [Allokutzneria sp. A3M-2-11 16]